MSYPKDLQDWVDEAHKNARNKGFWDDQMIPHPNPDVEHGVIDKALVRQTLGEKLMLIVTEAAEAMEDHRKNDMVTVFHCKNCGVTTSFDTCDKCNKLAKPIGFPSELADIVIRCFDLSGALGIDLEQEIRLKMRYNATRERMHGKVC